MNNGHIEQIDSPQRLFDFPSTSFVAKFMGYDNELEAQVEDVEEEKVYIHSAETHFTIPRQRCSGEIRKGDKVVMFFRPDRTEVFDSQMENSIRGTIKFKSFLGTRIQYLIQTEDENELNIFCPREGDRKEKETIYIRIDQQGIMVEKAAERIPQK
jgi:putative spermidine/putrescine transport system ATP-binding protein